MRIPLPRTALRASLLAAAVSAVAACETISEPEEQRLVDVLLDFCANDTPLWFAYQNEDSAWVRKTPDAEGTFAFTATNRVALAFVRVNGADTRTEIIYAHNLELEQISGRACLEESGGKQLNGTVTGVTTGDLAQVTMNFASVYLQSNQSSFSLSALPDRPVDLIASRVSVSGQSQASNRVIIRRNQNLVNNATMPNLDFSVVSTEVFTPTTATVTITGATGSGGYVVSNFFSQQETSHVLAYLDGLPPATVAVTAIPQAHLVTGDYHDISAVVFDANFNARGAERFFHVPGPQSLAIAGETTPPDVSTIASSPYLRLRAEADRPTAYGGALFMEYVQSGSTSETVVAVTETRLYHGTGGDWRTDIPDLSGVAGWQNAWGLQPGGAPIEWTSIVYGGRAELLFGAPPEEGEGLPFATFTSSPATAQAFVTARPFVRRPRPFGPAR